jgi:hypothetical protein
LSWFRMRSHCEVCGLAFERVLLQYGTIALMVVAPFVLFPFTKTLFLAFDLVFRPADS